MKILKSWILVCAFVFVGLAARSAEASAKLIPELEPLRPFLGKTWKGHFKNSTPEKPVVDISKWERALNGQAIRVLHSINNGVYGGETIFMVNGKTKEIEYHYFTTAGFMTKGTMVVEGKKMISKETVVGNQEGVTEVHATSEITADGKLKVVSRYLKEGEWVDGHSVTYEQAPDASVIFK